MKNFIGLALFAAAIGSLAIGAAAGQGTPEAPPLSVEKVRDGIYLVQGGSGANAGFIVGDKEVFVIDVKMSPDSAREMLAAIRRVTPLPVTTVLLTHSDGDHVNGFPGIPKGLKIVAQERCRADLVQASADQAFLADYLPNETFTDRLTLGSGKTTLELRNFGPAHTSGDAVVFIPGAKVAFVGDLVFLGRDPLIHLRKNGSSFGLVKTLNAILAYRPEVETFLSGHAGPASRADVKGLIESIEAKQAKVKALVAEGKSLDDVKKAFEIADPAAGRARFPGLVEVIYTELTEKRPPRP
jgi:cyclase